MSLIFNQLNTDSRLPSVRFEISSRKAVSGLGQVEEIVIIGQRLAAGTAIEGSVNDIFSVDQAQLLFGIGSQLADMIELFGINNPNIPVTAIPLDDAGINATKTITITGTATSAATITVWAGGRFVRVPVNIGDDANAIAANIEAALDADPQILFGASSATNVVTLVSRNQGAWAEDLVVAVSPRLVENGGSDVVPAGVTFAVASTVTGTGNPVLKTALDAIPDEIFNYILQPYSDDTNLDALDAELITRQNGNVQLEGHSFNAIQGDATAITVYGADRNSEFSTTMSAIEDSLSPEHHWASVYAGAASSRAQNDPALPWIGLVLQGLEAGTREKRFSDAERESFLLKGVAVHKVSKTGVITIDRGATNFQTNAASQPSVAFLDSMTSLSLSFARQAYIRRFTELYFLDPHKLVKNNATVSGQSNITTPDDVKGEAVALARELEQIGIFEDVDTFAALITTEIGPSVNAVSVKMPPDLVNQLRQILGIIEFRL